MKTRDIYRNVKIVLAGEPDPAFTRRADIVLESLDLSGKEEILEVGCGRGFYLRTLDQILPLLDITGIDLNEKCLRIAKEFINNPKVKLTKADATNLPFKDRTFGRIIATELLEHIPDDRKAIAEIYRVLKPGGIVMITVPNRNYPFFWDPANWILERLSKRHLPSNIWWLSGIWADHQRLYKRQDLEKLLQEKGFIVEKFWSCTHYCFPFSHLFLYGIGKNLVERGFCSGFDRFSFEKKSSWVNRVFLWPIRKIDALNSDSQTYESSVNLIWKIGKPKD